MGEEMLQTKARRLDEILSELGSVAVAYSGGVDSAYLLHAAHRVLGDRCVAVTAVSPSLAAAEREEARALAERIGARQLEVDARELENPDYARNDGQRCFHCKVEMSRVAREAAAGLGLDHVIYGAVADDVGDYRPGMEAAKQAGVRAPLLEAGLTKEEVRALSREAGLPTADKPATPCLASRLAYGVEVTPERLAQVEQAETALRGLGFRVLRVRHHGDVGRIEVAPEEIGRLLEEGTREKALAALREAGFTHAAVDLRGYRSGSLNEALLKIGQKEEEEP